MIQDYYYILSLEDQSEAVYKICTRSFKDPTISHSARKTLEDIAKYCINDPQAQEVAQEIYGRVSRKMLGSYNRKNIWCALFYAFQANYNRYSEAFKIERAYQTIMSHEPQPKAPARHAISLLDPTKVESPLPPELWAYIFGFGSIKDLLSLESTCKYFRSIIENISFPEQGIPSLKERLIEWKQDPLNNPNSILDPIVIKNDGFFRSIDHCSKLQLKRQSDYYETGRGCIHFFPGKRGLIVNRNYFEREQLKGSYQLSVQISLIGHDFVVALIKTKDWFGDPSYQIFYTAERSWKDGVLADWGHTLDRVNAIRVLNLFRLQALDQLDVLGPDFNVDRDLILNNF